MRDFNKTKEIRLRPRTADHDLRRLVNQAKKFLRKGFEVKVVVRLRGREKRTSLEAARYKLDEFAAIGKVKNGPRLNGSSYIMTIM